MPQSLRRLLGLLIILLLVAPARAQDDDFEDEDYLPGLTAEYTADGQRVRRIDPDVAFVWGADSPDRRLSGNDFRARWTGRLMLQEPETYRFHAYVQGKVSLTIDGLEVLSGERAQPGWISGPPVEFDFGEFDLEAVFEKTADDAEVKLFWSAERFEREPLPARFLFRDESGSDWLQIERGRTAFDVHRCNRCHRREEDLLSAPAPSLAHAAGGLSREWIVNLLSDPMAVDSHAKMPSFGFDRTQAEAIAAYLLRSQPVETQELRKVEDEAAARREGEILFRSVGCLACHTHGE